MSPRWRWLQAILRRAQDDADSLGAGDVRPDPIGETGPTVAEPEVTAIWSELESGEKPAGGFHRPPTLEAWETLAERRIREAQERGEFDNLKGAGKPLNLDNNPYAGEWELGFHMLKQAGYTLPWIELGKEIEADRAALRALLESCSARLLVMRQNARTATERREYEDERGRYRDRYLRMAAELDRKLAEYSSEVPSWRMDRGRVPPDLAGRQFDEACPPA